MVKRRTTSSQEAVLSILTNAQKAMSQDVIVAKMEVGADRATIYRILNRFCDDGLVHKIVADDGKQYFAVCRKCDDKTMPDNHYHFRCTKCETIECLPVVVDMSVPSGYLVQRMNCVLIGICRECA
ncbi:MAG: transcriptional repressor [Bacteroidota bacterium]